VTGDRTVGANVFVRDRVAGTTERVSVDSAGVQGDLDSYAPAISADGRFVAFQSDATNLVPGDTNGSVDIFVRDRQLGTTERVSLDPLGAQGSGASLSPAISADGRFVAFQSSSTTFVVPDANGTTTSSCAIAWLARPSAPASLPAARRATGPASSRALGRRALRRVREPGLDARRRRRQPGLRRVRHDRLTGNDRARQRRRRRRRGHGAERGRLRGSISASGRYVAFESQAPNLVVGDTNGCRRLRARPPDQHDRA
jgi:hypothetical protein